MLEGMEHEEAARLVGLSRSAAYEWHNCYEEDGIEGLRDRRRPGRPPLVGDVAKRREIAESVITGRKSGAEMARLYNISQPTVSRIVAQHRMCSL